MKELGVEAEKQGEQQGEKMDPGCEKKKKNLPLLCILPPYFNIL